MSRKKNYSKMYSSVEEPVVVDEPVEQAAVDTTPEAVTGTVVKCAQLNVREQMSTSSAVLCVLPASTKVTVFADEKYDDWYRVCTDDQVLGFCMKKYIQL